MRMRRGARSEKDGPVDCEAATNLCFRQAPLTTYVYEVWKLNSCSSVLFSYRNKKAARELLRLQCMTSVALHVTCVYRECINYGGFKSSANI